VIEWILPYIKREIRKAFAGGLSGTVNPNLSWGATQAAGNTLSTGSTTLNLDTENVNTDSNVFTLSSDQLTIDEDEQFLFTGQVTIMASSNFRGYMVLEENTGSGWAVVNGSISHFGDR
jgi:hypothetical protein